MISGVGRATSSKQKATEYVRYPTATVSRWIEVMPPDRNILPELSSIAAQGSDRHEKAQRIAVAIRLAGSYRWVGIYDVDVRRSLVQNLAWSGPSAPAHPTFPVTKGLTSRAIATKMTVNVGDVAQDAEYLMALSSTRSEIIIPVIGAAGDIPVGTLDVESEQLNAFDLVTQKWLEECAGAIRPLWDRATT